jgi:hypothetical protein
VNQVVHHLLILLLVGDDITIPKVKLFENTSPVAPKLLKEVSYERTVNAHKIYVKTTFVASNYIDDLRSVDTRIGNAYVNRLTLVIYGVYC